MDQEMQTSEMQPLLYAVESFDQIYEAAKLAEVAGVRRIWG